MKISVLPSVYENVERIAEPTSVEELGHLVTSCAVYSGSIFADNKPANANFLSTDVMVLDYDNTDPEVARVSLDDACRIFGDYKCLIATTRNHQKWKKEIYPPDDRFRVILFLETTITDADDYEATWHHVAKLFPGCDTACKDPARRMYASVDIVKINETGKLLAPIKATPKPKHSERIAPVVGLTGKLSRATQDFLSKGVKSNWNQSLFKAAKDAQEQGYTQDWFIEQAERMSEQYEGQLNAADLKTIASAYSTEPKYAPRIVPTEPVKRLIERCHMIKNIADASEIRFVDLKRGSEELIDPKMLAECMDKDEASKYVAERLVYAKLTYDPTLAKPLTVCPITDVHIYNSYVPAEWRADTYYHGNPLPYVAELPKLYADFFIHLTNGHVESREYMLDWIANSLKTRNFTILSAIGDQGIGKGTLGKILRLLHGENNFSEATDNVFKNKFNSKLENKTLVYVDEIDLKTKESQDRIKAVVNDFIEIEKKGIDSTTARNYASFYISSNSMDAIKLEAGDRRYSIVNLTKTKLLATDLIDRVEELVELENIAALGAYLWHRKITHNMLVPFRSERTEDVRRASLMPWEEAILDELAERYKGGEPLVTIVTEEALQLSGTPERYRPGRRKIKALAELWPDKLQFFKRGENYHLKFL